MQTTTLIELDSTAILISFYTIKELKSVKNMDIQLVICDRLSAQRSAIIEVCEELQLRYLFDGPHLLKSLRKGLISISALDPVPTPAGYVSSAPLFALYEISKQPFAVCILPL